ncbi:MAG TPA: metal-sensitive transcriptional regulator [Patescibacteria group bacterium]|nr:metal-sensitive transcriptional regulator [Patescibacteria group bacterium]
MQHKYRGKLINHLHRLQGQLAGIERMLNKNAYCVDIIVQSRAVQRSLGSFDRQLLKNHLEEHVPHQFSRGHAHRAVKELLEIYKLRG